MGSCTYLSQRRMCLGEFEKSLSLMRDKVKRRHFVNFSEPAACLNVYAFFVFPDMVFTLVSKGDGDGVHFDHSSK